MIKRPEAITLKKTLFRFSRIRVWEKPLIVAIISLLLIGCREHRPLKEISEKLYYGQNNGNIQKEYLSLYATETQRYSPPKDIVNLPLTSSFNIHTGFVGVSVYYENKLGFIRYESLNLYFSEEGRLLGFEYDLPD